MDPEVQYKTIKEATRGLYRDRGSKFLAYLVPVKSVEEVRKIQEEISAEHPKARHLCFAYRLGPGGKVFRISDDGEPSGSAGRPIFNELLSADLSDVFCGVIRYFGGTKLGVPGLIKAYKSAAFEAISYAGYRIETLTKEVTIDFPIEDMGRIYEILKRLGYSEITSAFDPHPRLTIEVRLDEIESFQQLFFAQYLGYGPGDIPEGFEVEGIRVMM